MFTNRLVFSFAIIVALKLAAIPSAVAGTLTYTVSHSFTFSADGGVTSDPSFLFGVSAQASPGGTTNANSGSVLIGPAGGSPTQQANSTGLFSSATASSSATVAPFVIGGAVSGVIASDGSIIVVPGSTCCAISSAAIVLGGGSSATHGSANWGPDMGMTCDTCDAPGIAPDGSEMDPIDFQVTDLKTGGITTGSLFSVSSNLQGTGSWSWTGGVFSLNAANFDFSINLNSPFTVQQGTATVQVRNGLITVSSGTGIFAGTFPAVGGSGIFAVPLSSDISINYNLGDFNGDPVAVQFALGDSGSACSVPEPSAALPLMIVLSVLGCGYRRRTGSRIALR